jgi:hypothetical protein
MGARAAAAALVAAVVVALGPGPAARAEQQTWVGMISDSQCRGDHGGEVDPTECTLKCIRNGDKFVLATDNGVHILPIANQTFAGLHEHAGQTVKVTGELKDGAITISRIDMP